MSILVDQNAKPGAEGGMHAAILYMFTNINYLIRKYISVSCQKNIWINHYSLFFPFFLAQITNMY